MRLWGLRIWGKRTDSEVVPAGQPGSVLPPEEPPAGFRAIVLREVPALEYRTVLMLWAAALVCRIGAALWWGDLLWADSVFYRQVADALEKGDFTKAFESLGLNLYPVILVWLDRLGALVGADWILMGKWWSVLIASLAVLPFYGWVRRLFNDRIAFWAGLFFAIHPHLVGHSPLIIRDPTYWFLLNLALYLSWRAAAEARLVVFLAAGLATGLAMYIRTEGILLAGVLVGWSLGRLFAVRQARCRVALGALLALAVIPVGVVTVNLTWLRGHPRWEWGRLPLLLRIWNWATDRIEDFFSSEPGPRLSPLSAPEQPNPGPLPSRPSIGANTPRQAKLIEGRKHLGSPQQTPSLLLAAHKGKIIPTSSSSTHSRSESDPQKEISKESEWLQARRVALRLIKALGYPYAFLIALGLLRAWWILLRTDQLVLSFHNLLLFLATWAYQSLSSGIDSRYLLPILLTALPYAVVGFEALLAVLSRRATSVQSCCSDHPGRRIALGGVLILGAIGLLEVQPTATKLMRQQTALGQWILQRQGPGSKIFCPESASILLGYHAQAQYRSWPRLAKAEPAAVRQLLLHYHPDVVVLWDDPIYPDRRWMEVVQELCPHLGYQKVPAEHLPEPASHCEVWIRPEKPPSATGNPPRGDSFYLRGFKLDFCQFP